MSEGLLGTAAEKSIFYDSTTEGLCSSLIPS